jgi:hypothetical protein
MLKELAAFIGIAMLSAPVIALALLLNRRDRREERLLGAVRDALWEFRGLYGVQARCAPLGWSSIVYVWLSTETPGEVWTIILLLSQRLPTGIRIVVDAPISERRAGRISTVTRPWMACGQESSRETSRTRPWPCSRGFRRPDGVAARPGVSPRSAATASCTTPPGAPQVRGKRVAT